MKLEDGCGKRISGTNEDGTYVELECGDFNNFCPICTKAIQVKHETLTAVKLDLRPSMNVRNDEKEIRKYIIGVQIAVDIKLKELETTGVIK